MQYRWKIAELWTSITTGHNSKSIINPRNIPQVNLKKKHPWTESLKKKNSPIKNRILLKKIQSGELSFEPP